MNGNNANRVVSDITISAAGMLIATNTTTNATSAAVHHPRCCNSGGFPAVIAKVYPRKCAIVEPFHLGRFGLADALRRQTTHGLVLRMCLWVYRRSAHQG
jgi:hypothetical protein